jgi:hypothetical protein
MTKQRDLDELIGPTDAAFILETSTETVRRWAKAGVLTPITITIPGGTRSVYRRGDVERVAAERRKGPKAAKPRE